MNLDITVADDHLVFRLIGAAPFGEQIIKAGGIRQIAQINHVTCSKIVNENLVLGRRIHNICIIACTAINTVLTNAYVDDVLARATICTITPSACGQDVIATTAIQDVITQAAIHRINAVTAIKNIARGVTDKGVVCIVAINAGINISSPDGKIALACKMEHAGYRGQRNISPIQTRTKRDAKFIYLNSVTDLVICAKVNCVIPA